MIASRTAGCAAATFSALANEFWSCACVASVTFLLGRGDLPYAIADAYPA